MFIENFKVESPNVKYTETEIQSVYNYETTELVHENRNGSYQWIVKPKSVKYEFKTSTNVPKLGVMLVGWGGNNGSTLTGGVIANKEGISWATKDKIERANYFGSLTQASAIRVGSFQGEEIYAPFKSLLPMVNPDDVVFGGWDISDMNLADAMGRARVFDIDLQKQLRPYMESMVPLPGIYDPDFIAANQGDRANNVIKGTKKEQIQQIIKDIKEFKEASKVDRVVVLWTANTERFSNLVVGLNDTMENLLASVDRNEAEISPSTLYAIACVMENIPFINGSPQNTFVPGLIDLAIKKNSLIGGDDFKSGQTKMKSVLVDFLVGAGIKPTSIVSYNHLGNNDGMNLSAPQTFRSKEISKSNVVDDMVNSNAILYEPGEHPDHVVVIKYVPYVADSKGKSKSKNESSEAEDKKLESSRAIAGGERMAQLEQQLQDTMDLMEREKVSNSSKSKRAQTLDNLWQAYRVKENRWMQKVRSFFVTNWFYNYWMWRGAIKTCCYKAGKGVKRLLAVRKELNWRQHYKR